MLRSKHLIGTVTLLVVLLASLSPDIASAHEKRTVGKYTFLVGWSSEPPYQGQMNGLDLTIADANGVPVEGAEKTLKVGVAYGGSAPKDLPLSARFGLKGKYTTAVIPTKAGTYSFAFTGSLNGDQVNETFESSPNTFDDVQPSTTIEIPAATEAAAQATGNTASDAAVQRATLLGAAGIAIGLIGIVLGGIALAVRSRPTETSVEDETQTGTPV
jgi:hypothetical protein